MSSSHADLPTKQFAKDMAQDEEALASNFVSQQIATTINCELPLPAASSVVCNLQCFVVLI
jgi:hypothetical protein